MCYFLNLEIRLQRGEAGAKGLIAELANRYGLHVQGEGPVLQITDGHCSCRLVANDGHSLRIAAFMDGLVSARDVKNVKVGWTWATGPDVQMLSGTVEHRLSLQDFLNCNQEKALQADIWYRLHDADKYKWER